MRCTRRCLALAALSPPSRSSSSTCSCQWPVGLWSPLVLPAARFTDTLTCATVCAGADAGAAPRGTSPAGAATRSHLCTARQVTGEIPNTPHNYTLHTVPHHTHNTTHTTTHTHHTHHTTTTMVQPHLFYQCEALPCCVA